MDSIVTHQTSYVEGTLVGHTTADDVKQLEIRLATTTRWFVPVCCNVCNLDIHVAHIATDQDKASYGGQPDHKLLSTSTTLHDSQHLHIQAVF